MATYLQWSRQRPVRPVTWVCGPEAVLARDVIAAHREGAPAGQCTVLRAGAGDERSLWDLLLSVPLDGGRRVTVHGAENLRHLGNVAVLAEAPELATAYVTFVSAAADFEREGGQLAPHLAAVQASKRGQLVRCCAPSKPGDRATLAASWWPGATADFGREVLARCGTLERAWLACEQARLAGLPATGGWLPAVCPADPGGELADLVLAGQRRAAALAAGRAGASELGAAVSLLAARLAVIEQVRAEMYDGRGVREACQAAHVDRYAALRVAPYVDSYPARRVVRCRRLLADVEAAWRSGAADGAAEVLVACW